ncbi:diguanylate cyclase [Vulgatibacter sp.]|uniref:diguanylate cyclase n=1 Tax=Vulgatibacter sp. TaxID=1971226 RepID=UPI00356A7544
MASLKTQVTRVGPGLTLPEGEGESCLVIIYGPGLGRRIPLLAAETVLGRDPSCNLVVELENVSRRHCVVRCRDAGVTIQDLASTNGTWVNEQEVRRPEERQLRSGDLIKVGGCILKFLQAGNVEALYHEEIYRTIVVDGLTQVHTKRYFLEFLDREMARCSRYGRPLSLLMFDVDNFKQVNDELGHLTGDYVLRELALLVKNRMIRKEELVARYGGEEFAVVLPESGPQKVRIFAEKLRALVADHRFLFETRRIPITVSVGVADMNSEIVDPVAFIKAADMNLLAAKRAGRNCVVG